MEKTYDITQGSKGIQRVQASPIRAILDRAAVLRSEGNKVIPLSAGEPNFNTPAPIKEAVKKAIDENYSHYGSNRGLAKLRQILSEQNARETGVTYDPETEVFITSSGAEAINNAILAFVDEGDEVIIFTPAFVSYKNLVKFCGGVFVDLPLKKEDGFQIDPAALEAAVTEKTKMIILNNPNNPTGAVYTRESLAAVAKIAVEHNLLVVSDEMYSKLTYEDARFTSICEFPGMKERSLIISGFSKTYAMTGWRLGWILTDKKLGVSLLRMHQYSTTCSPTFIQKGLADAMLLPETQAEVTCHGGCLCQKKTADPVWAGRDPAAFLREALRRFLCDGGRVEDRAYRTGICLASFGGAVCGNGTGHRSGRYLRGFHPDFLCGIGRGYRGRAAAHPHTDRKTWRIKNEGEGRRCCVSFTADAIFAAGIRLCLCQGGHHHKGRAEGTDGAGH